MYYIYDELGELMRKVKRKEEAQQLIQIRTGWTYVHIRAKRKIVDLSSFDDAPF